MPKRRRTSKRSSHRAVLPRPACSSPVITDAGLSSKTSARKAFGSATSSAAWSSAGSSAHTAPLPALTDCSLRQRGSPLFSLAVEYIDGIDLGGLTRGEIGRDVIEQFERIVDDLHSRGWVHLDLQRRSNILLVNGKVFVVDLASAFHPGGIPLIGRGLTRFLGFFDRLSLIKLKSIYAPDSLTRAERKWLKARNLVMPKKW